jgi:short-subunit dehydrogenase
MKLLSDRFALITGASQGLGRALALAYANEDVRGLALVARGKEPLQKLKSDIDKIAPATDVVIIQATSA